VYSIDMLSVFCSPSRYTQGRNATASLGQEIVNLGLEGPALIVAGKSAIALLSGVWESSLRTAGLMHSILRFGGECSLLEIEKGKAAARKSDARIIIGAGGGKCSTRPALWHRISTYRW
jgi:glycerol dehydrogenase